eukprot:gene25767-32257_t
MSLASGGADCDIVLWDLVTNTGVSRLRGHKDAVTALVFIKQNSRSYLVSVSKDTLMKVWDPETRFSTSRFIDTLPLHFLVSVGHGGGGGGGGDRGGYKGGYRNEGRGRNRELSESDKAKYAGMTGAQIERARTKQRTEQLARLTRNDYRDWQDILAGLTLSRASIKEAMGFAFDKIESAEEIVAMVRDQLVLPSSHAAVKIAGLYLLSDILHNSGAPVKHAASYRGLIQNVLPEIFDNVATMFRTTQGRMSAFQIEDRVKRLLLVWEDWSIFPALFLVGLQAMFYLSEGEHGALLKYVAIKTAADSTDPSSSSSGPSADDIEALKRRARAAGVHRSDSTSRHEVEFRLDFVERYAKSLLSGSTSGGDASAATSILAAFGGDIGRISGGGHDTSPSSSGTGNRVSYLEQLNQQQAAEEDENDIDGAPLSPVLATHGFVVMSSAVRNVNEEADIDGAPFEDIDGMPLEDIDGAPMTQEGEGEEDVDGVPYDDDLDGVPM